MLNSSPLSCFNTQPREGGCNGLSGFERKRYVSTHSRAKAAAFLRASKRCFFALFQHTAARRRLHNEKLQALENILGFNTQPREGGCPLLVAYYKDFKVSTHSRAKAAAATAN